MNDIDVSHTLGHAVSAVAVLGSLIGLLPAVAAIAAAVWYSIQIFESNTCQKYVERRRTQRKIRRITKLTAEHKMLIAELDAITMVREARATAADKVAAAATEARRQLSADITSKTVQDAVDEVVKSTPRP